MSSSTLTLQYSPGINFLHSCAVYGLDFALDKQCSTDQCVCGPESYLRQCAIPVFEGLLPSHHNEIVMTLLYRLAEWHALAKLRMHTDPTLDFLDSITSILGRELRRF